MRGSESSQVNLFSYITPENRVPEDHPLRPMKTMVNQILEILSPDFHAIYSKVGRPSIPPEYLLRATVLQIIYSIRSERQLMEQLDFNILYRWFVGLDMDSPVWNHSVFSKNRDRLLESEIARSFLDRVIKLAREKKLLSSEHFSVDGTLIEAWASHKSFRPKDSNDEPPDDPGNRTVDFHGENRTNDTHESTTDPDSRLFKKGKGKEAKLCFMGHALMENRNGLVVDACVTQATGTAERESAVGMLRFQESGKRITCGADKGYDTADFVQQTRSLRVTPHVAQVEHRPSAIDARTTNHPGYGLSMKARKRIEEIFGWLKTVGGFRRIKYRGLRLVSWFWEFSVGVYNLVRIRNILKMA